MNEIAVKRQYYPALDGLRGVAILMVVIFHNFGFVNYFFFGWLGVDLFFVLSGFLITEILLKTLGKPGFLGNFYLRRILRIFPLYFTVLIICLLVLPLFPHLNVNLKYYTDHQWWFWLFVQNWLFILHQPEQNNFLLHLWSIAVEEQFYIIWPFIILFVKKPKPLLAIVLGLLIGIMLARSLLWIYNIEGLKYFNLYIFTRIDGICIGCALALTKAIKFNFVKNNTALLVSFFSLVNFIFFFLNRGHNFTYPYYPFIGYTTFAIIFAILVNEAASDNSGLAVKIFKNPILKFFGKVSYGFYLLHWPVYLLVYPLLVSWFTKYYSQHYTSVKLVSASIATCLGFLLSVISYYYFEMYFLRLKQKLKVSSAIHLQKS